MTYGNKFEAIERITNWHWATSKVMFIARKLLFEGFVAIFVIAYI